MRRKWAVSPRIESLSGGKRILRPHPPETTLAPLSESLSAPKGDLKKMTHPHLTQTPTGQIYSLSSAVIRVGSMAKTAMSGFAARQTTRRPKPRQNCAVLPFPAPCGPGLWVRADGGAKARRFLVGGTANSVRPARQICSLACRVLKTCEETCHV